MTQKESINATGKHAIPETVLPVCVYICKASVKEQWVRERERERENKNNGGETEEEEHPREARQVSGETGEAEA